MDLESDIRAKYLALKGILNERARRLWAATESRSVGYGGDAIVASATGLARDAIRNGREELYSGAATMGRQRRTGAGRKVLSETQEGWTETLDLLVSPTSRGDPMSPLRWTCKSTRILAVELGKLGFSVSHMSVGRKLRELDYSLHVLRKNREGEDHPDRNAQFEYINAMVQEFQARDQPVVADPLD